MFYGYECFKYLFYRYFYLWTKKALSNATNAAINGKQKAN